MTHCSRLGLVLVSMAFACTDTPSESIAGATLVAQANARSAFGFNADSIRGFPTGAASLTGGGAYVPESGFVRSGGSFDCLEDIHQGPLNGCLAGEGVRWDPVQLQPFFDIKCTGATAEQLKRVVTDENTVVILADFYRAGDGVDESFTANMFVSEVDEAPEIPGIQNVWIQGVGCGEAITNFNRAR